MPFTVVTDTMLAVQPNAEYVKVEFSTKSGLWSSNALSQSWRNLGIKEYAIIETVTGKSLEGTAYDYPLKDIIPKQAELETKHPLVHHVIGEEFVDVNTATGVVHLSPGNGEDDFWAAQPTRRPHFRAFRRRSQIH